MTDRDSHDAQQLPTGARVIHTSAGTVRFVRSGFARIRWDDGRETDEWVPDLVIEKEST